MALERRREQAQAALTRPVRVMSCYEGGYDGFWLHRFLCDRGIDNQVLDAASILVHRRTADAAALLRTSWRWNVASPRVCRVVRVPSLGQETIAVAAGNGLGSSTNAASIRAASRGF